MFVGLMLFGLTLVLVYIFQVGHSLNAAAAKIDDKAGSMEDYAVILYEGLTEEKQPVATDDSKTSSKLNQKAQSSTQPENELTASSALPSSGDNAQDVVSVDSVKQSYIEKNASVFVLDVANPSVYNQSNIVRAGKYSFGIFYVDKNHCDAAYLAQRVDEYKKAQTDFIVAVVSDLSLLSDTAGLHIVVSTKDEGLLDEGILVDGVFYNDAACLHEVGTIVVSPTKLISAKDIDSL